MDIRDGGALPSKKEQEIEDIVFELDQAQTEDIGKVGFDLKNRTENKAFLDIMLGNLIKQLNLNTQIKRDYESQVKKQFGKSSIRDYITLPYVEVYFFFYPTYLVFKRKFKFSKLIMWTTILAVANDFHRQSCIKNHQKKKYIQYKQFKDDYDEMMDVYKSSLSPDEILLTTLGLMNEAPVLVKENEKEKREQQLEFMKKAILECTEQLTFELN